MKNFQSASALIMGSGSGLSASLARAFARGYSDSAGEPDAPSVLAPTTC